MNQLTEIEETELEEFKKRKRKELDEEWLKFKKRNRSWHEGESQEINIKSFNSNGFLNDKYIYKKGYRLTYKDYLSALDFGSLLSWGTVIFILILAYFHG